MIVKFQKSVFSPGKVLIYNYQRTVLQEIPLTKAINIMFAGRSKMYCECRLDDDGTLYIGQEVKAKF